MNAVMLVDSRKQKNFMVNKLPSVSHYEGQFVINGQSCGHNGAKAPSLNAVLLQYLLLDVSRKITIALMVGLK